MDEILQKNLSNLEYIGCDEDWDGRTRRSFHQSTRNATPKWGIRIFWTTLLVLKTVFKTRKSSVIIICSFPSRNNSWEEKTSNNFGHFLTKSLPRSWGLEPHLDRSLFLSLAEFEVREGEEAYNSISSFEQFILNSAILALVFSSLLHSRLSLTILLNLPFFSSVFAISN